MLTVVQIVIILTCVTVASPIKAQQEQEFKYYRDSYKKVASNYRTMVRQHLKLEERQQLDRIRFKFSRSHDMIAEAYVGDGQQRVIRVSYGFLAIMEHLTFAFAVTGEAGKDACFLHYLDAVGQALLRNTERRLRGQGQRERIPLLVHYIEEGGEECASISQSDFQNPEALEFFPGGMDAILVFVIGHEVAHHLLHHVDGEGPSTLQESRQFEAAADIWAIERAFDIDINPFPAGPLWALFSIIGGADISAELVSSHPLGITRWADALDLIVETMQSEEYEQEFGPIPDFVLEDVIRSRDSILSALRNLGLID